MTCFDKYLIPAMIPLIISCNTESKTLNDFSAFTGKWQLDEVGRNYTETWFIDGDNLSGKAVELADGDTIFYEEMTLFERGEDGWVLGVTVADQNQSNTVFFQLMESRTNYFQFENSTHDFPKRIIYEMKGDDRMEARVDGGEEGDQILNFSFVRIQ